MTARAFKRGSAIALVIALSSIAIQQGAVAQPDPTIPPGTGSNPGASGDPGPGSSGSAGTTGSAGSGSAGSGSAGSGSAGSGSAPAGSGSAKPKGPTIIPVPNDINAPQVSAAAAPTTVQLGQKFTVFITATFNPGVEVNLREPLDLGPGFEVTRRLSEDVKGANGDGTTTREWQLEVVAWDLGDLIIPPIAVTYTAMGKADQVGTNAVKVKVNGMLGDVVDDPKAMRSDAPPTELLRRDWFWLYVAIAGFLVVGALTTIAVLIRNSRRRRMMFVGTGFTTSTRKFDSASERALYKLGELEKSGVLDDDDTRKQGYAAMVEIIREYIGSRYRVATLDLTSAELVAKLGPGSSGSPHAPEAERTMIEAWLERTDIVKYGGLKASSGQAKETLEAARTLVVVTTTHPTAAKPEPPPESPPPPPPEPPAPPPRAGSDGGDDAKTTPFSPVSKEEAA